MKLTAATLTALLAVTTSAHKPTRLPKRAAVFPDMTFNELSISAGPAGSAAEKAAEKLAGLPEDLSTTDPADITFLNTVNLICNQAEVGAFDPVIAGSAPGEEALAVDCGKTANKILKLMATMLKLQAQEATGDPEFDAAKLADTQDKLAKNIDTDVKNGEAGLECVSQDFEATTADPAATDNEGSTQLELDAENVAFDSRTLLGIADPPGAKATREKAEADLLAEQEAAAAAA